MAELQKGSNAQHSRSTTLPHIEWSMTRQPGSRAASAASQTYLGNVIPAHDKSPTSGQDGRARSTHQEDGDQTIKDLLVGLVSSTDIARLSPPISPPTLPTEASPLGFCKGAVRLLSPGGEDLKRNFMLIVRPSGFASSRRYWKCRSCAFEGPASTIGGLRGNKTKMEDVFDTTVSQSRGGVRFKWIFLAKCHVPWNVTPTASVGTRTLGMFACVFCDGKGDAQSRESGIGNGDIPGFVNVGGFLEHLEKVHRAEAGWPSDDLQARMKCIVGRVAEVDEDWEVNLLPAAAEEGASGK